MKKEDRLLLTFNDASSRNEARKIFESSTQGKELFSNISDRNKRYPVIVKFVNLDSIPLDVKSDIEMRQSSGGLCALSINYFPIEGQTGWPHETLATFAPGSRSSDK